MHVNENLIGHFNVKTYSIDYVTVVLSVLLINTEALECERIFLICEKGVFASVIYCHPGR